MRIKSMYELWTLVQAVDESYRLTTSDYTALVIEMKILFICVANSARSQMAEGLAREMLGAKFTVASAGSAPAEHVHPLAERAMSEIGIDISNHKPKSIASLDRDFWAQVDWVIPLCAEEQCPALNGNFQIASWALPDPAAQADGKDALESFRQTRDAIKAKILQFKSSLEGTAKWPSAQS